MAAEARIGRPAWSLTLVGGAIAQAVVSMLLLTGDRSGIRPEVARDIVIVGVLGIVVAILVALLAPSAETSKTVRRVLIGAVVLMTFVSLAGAMAMAVTAWTVVPAGVMILGLVLLYRDIRGRGDGEA
ncbi:hypothetical protein [Corynebacterium xerosis]|uniref:Uncharacterized protein n=1 Tax=Corynebacterium xerosis TaxID=1725 RepID=A0A0M2XGH4_9CORY|nr:hypothetical protein [Corynebacterium xerosis]KKO80898.1 hypothetical protein WU86_09775 [Corynebacterium xerosis]NMF09073.1 hypothetical protein [Corynebacterium xerosis]SQB95304.1 Uncharacterised protein [Clostridium paraputrificum]HJG58099.1 hypothetical protein [Corynebacterium xerosis]